MSEAGACAGLEPKIRTLTFVMKYYYKSPEELREYIAQGHKKAIGPFRHRTFIIILLDIVLFMAVFGVLYYQGYLTPGSATSASTESFDGLEFSISVPKLPRGSEAVTLYLNIKNTGTRARDFPPPAGPATLREIKIEFFAEKIFLHGHALQNKTLPATATIPAGGTRIFPLSVQFPFDRRGAGFYYSARVHLVMDGRLLSLSLPPVQSQP